MIQTSCELGFEHRIEWSGDILRVALRGSLVYETLGPLQSCWEAVRKQHRSTVVVDLSGVTFLASGPLGSLIALQCWLATRGHQLLLASPSLDVREALRLTGLADLFSIDDTAGEIAS